MSGTAPGTTALEAARTASEGHGRTARRRERRGLPAGAAGCSGIGSANADPGRARGAGSGAAVIPFAPRGARPAPPPAPAARPASSGTAASLTADSSPPAPTTRTLEVSR